MKFLSHTIAFTFNSDSIPANFQPLIELPLVIMVGLTGVGKSTTMALLPENGLTFTLLPNRREITDELIIATLQNEAGQPLQPVTDRLERFEYTARYRAKFPGGMAHALSRLIINPAQLDLPLIFDGLRGLDEVQHAVTYFPQARFVVLDAPDLIRLSRLFKRADAFDSAAAPPLPAAQAQDAVAVLLAVPDIETVFNEEQLYQIAQTTGLDQISVDEVVQKISIIVKERRNYDSSAARAYLSRTLSPEQMLVIDTAAFSPPAVAAQIAAWLTAS